MHMAVFFMLAAAYLLYFIYDWRSAARPGSRFDGALFTAATALVALATGVFIYKSARYASGLKTYILLPAALLALTGLIISVFFSLPAGTYSRPGERRPAFRSGLYALCRHPGVLSYCLFYIFLLAAMPSAQGAAECAAFCAGDLLYMLFQDMWSFPRIFSDYDEYKRETPMFFPTGESIRRCIEASKNT